MRVMAFAILASTAIVPAAWAQSSSQAPAQPAGTQPGQAQQQQAQQHAGQNRPVAASEIRGKDVVNARGESMGRIERVMVGQDGQAYAVVRFAEAAGAGTEPRMVSANRLSMRENRLVLTGEVGELRQMEAYKTDRQGFREAEQNQQIALGPQKPAQGQQANAQQQADASRIVVQQAAPTIRVDQASPQVTVQQPQPNVTVFQPQPEIIVRQPQPTVTVNIPQPEIIVRMPQPDVNVAMAQPQVQVSQPQPQVLVQRNNQQPQVQVERGQAQVQVVPPQGQANVQIQRNAGEPQVRYEAAEPRVVVNRQQGEPNVRFERMGEAQTSQQADAQNPQARQQTAQHAQPGAAPRVSDPAGLGGTVAPPAPRPNQEASSQTGQTTQGQQQAQGSSVYSEDQRRGLRERFNAGDAETTGSVSANAQTRPLPISDLENMNVYNGRGNELGEVDRVIVTAEGRQFLVVGSGGFLGIGRDRVAFPMDRFWLRGDRLVIRGVTEQDIEAMDDYRDSLDRFQRMSRNDRANLRVWQ